MPYMAYCRWSQRGDFHSTKVPSFLLWSRGKDTLPLFVWWCISLCLSNLEAQEVLKEALDGICGAHHPGPKLKDQLYKLGYYWPTMIVDAVQYAKWCKTCQIHADFIHQQLKMLHTTMTSWPFEAWRIDVIGYISPPSARGHRYIPAIITSLSGRKLYYSPKLKWTMLLTS